MSSKERLRQKAQKVGLMVMLKDNLAAVLAELKQYNVSLRKMSQEIGMNAGFLGNILAGNNQNPSDAFYDYFQVRFNVSPEYLRTGEGEMFLPGGKQNNYRKASLLAMLYALPEDEQELVFSLIRVLSRKHGSAREDAKT